MKPVTLKIIEKFASENRLLWGDKFFIRIEDKNVVLMTEGLVRSLSDLLGDHTGISVTSLDKNESVGEWFRVKGDVVSHVHHYHRSSRETNRLLQNLPHKDMMTVEEEDGQVVTKNELMAGELFRGVTIGNWIAAVIYHDFVEIAPKVVGWIKLDDRIEKIDKKDFFRPRKLLSLDEVITDLIDLPYHLGGKSLQTGFDCSSTIQWIMFHTKGIWLPKLAKWQSLVGTNISPKTTQKGDLVFYEESPDWTIEHVGILLDRSNMLHAYSTKGKIVVEAPNLIVKNRQSTMKIGKYTRISSK